MFPDASGGTAVPVPTAVLPSERLAVPVLLQMVHGRSVPCRSAALPLQSVLPAERMYCQSSLP